MSDRPVTMKMVARAAGLHPSSVSLALRNHPSIPESTRRRIRALADRMGYRPNPQVASLMQYLRGTRAVPAGTPILLVNPRSDPAAPAKFHFYQNLWEGARRRADELGFACDEVWLGDPALSPRRFNRIVQTRGVAGIFLGPLDHPGQTLDMDWSLCAFVAFGWSLARPAVHRVAPHQFHIMRTLLHTLRARGRRRIAFIETRDLIQRVDGTYLAAFLEYNAGLPRAQAIPPWLLDAPQPRALPGLAAFLRRHRPDAIVNEFLPFHEWLPPLGRSIPDDIALASTNRHANPKSGLAGMDQQMARIGAAAVDSLAAQVARNERGLPETPKTIFIEGRWMDGWSAPL